MSTNGISPSEDTDMAEYDGEKVVTMMDVLQEQQDFEEDANAVLGASDDKNCTYSKGYIKRQAIYACLTCCAEAKADPSKRAGVCLACSLTCHENHELIELYTKRNFRCDCGNPKFNSHPCQYTPNKTDLNDENLYNQNFSGLYCVCHRPYPDPEIPEEDEMIQCIICEDWLHSSHLEATVPGNDQYTEMVCKMCMNTNEFLHDYSNLAVNVENEDVEITSCCTKAILNESVKLNGSDGLLLQANDDVDHDKVTDANDNTSATEEKKEVKEQIKMENIISTDANLITDTTKEQSNSVDNPDSKVDTDNESTQMTTEISETSGHKKLDEDKITGETVLGPEETEGGKDQISDAEPASVIDEQKTKESEAMDTETPQIEIDKSSVIEGNSEQTGNPADKPDSENIVKVQNETIDTDKDSSICPEENDQEHATENKNGTEITKNNSASITNKINVDKESENESIVTKDEFNQNQNENKRKLSTEDETEDLIAKKQKIDGVQCKRPKGVKRIYKGATFWPSDFRPKLCTCNECTSMYKDLSVLFLIDLEDTVTAYETLGMEKVDGAPASQYEKGLQALSSLDRVQQINALTEYNKMKDKLLDFLKSFKDRKEVVKEEDIKAFFAGMKPKREPDGVYFCR